MRIGVDIGGTFTDFVLLEEESGAFRTHKVFSTPKDPARAFLDGLAELGVPGEAPIVHGSTVATNAVLERKGARTAFITSRGFKDLLHIGRQARAQLYSLRPNRPQPLVPRALCLEVEERVDAQGKVVVPLDPADLPRLVERLRRRRVQSVALCLLFSFLHPHHEAAMGEALRAAGFSVSLSSEILPEFREYERASTTVINAYVAPIIDRYLGNLEARLGPARLRVLQSNGGSMNAQRARRQPVRTILSGPAGGVVGARFVAQEAGFDRIITFDMGGTSTDVSLCEGEMPLTSEGSIAGHPLRVPMVDLHTVGAGGGSIGWVDLGGALQVGPQSAGADPGPACYGRGGAEPTVTDAHLLLGRLPTEGFLGGRMALEEGAAREALQRLAREAGLVSPGGMSAAQQAALGMVQVVDAAMARALRVISVERGHDPRRFTLVCFGGAGGLHATQLARQLGIPRVLFPPMAATLSAFGMLAAQVVKDEVRTVMLPGDTPLGTLQDHLRPMLRRAQAEMAAEGLVGDQVQYIPLADLRYQGQGYELTVPLNAALLDSFHHLHQRAYGHSDPGAPVEIVNLRLQALGSLPRPQLRAESPGDPDPSAARFDRRPVVLEGGAQREVDFYRGQALRPGHRLRGPALLLYPDTTLLLLPGDRAEVDGRRNVVVEIGKD
jgi:N-methylhydantoinase A